MAFAPSQPFKTTLAIVLAVFSVALCSVQLYGMRVEKESLLGAAALAPGIVSVRPQTCFLEIQINEKKVGTSVQFSVESVGKAKGAQYGSLVETYYPEEPSEYILEEWIGATKFKSYALHSTRFLITEDFLATDSRSRIDEAREGTILAYVPYRSQNPQILGGTQADSQYPSFRTVANGKSSDLFSTELSGKYPYEAFECEDNIFIDDGKTVNSISQ